MAKLVGQHAVVVGAGIGGLSAAKALSSYFANVTVLERDVLPSAPTMREKTHGQRPHDFSQRLKLNLALQRVGAEDARVHQIMSEVTHLVK